MVPLPRIVSFPSKGKVHQATVHYCTIKYIEKKTLKEQHTHELNVW